MPRLKNRPPVYRHHKASGQAIVAITGRDHYLGPYGSPGSHKKYQQFVARWVAGRHELNAQGRQALMAERRAELDRRVWHYGYDSVLISSLVKEMGNVRYGRGRGGASQQWRVVMRNADRRVESDSLHSKPGTAVVASDSR